MLIATIAILSLTLVLNADVGRANSGAEFLGLGQVPGTTQGSRALGISSDGTTVVGDCQGAAGCPEAWRFTNESGLEGLGFLPGDTESSAVDASTDGGFIVGTSDQDGFRWSSGSGMQATVTGLAGEVGIAAVSEDGVTSVGAHFDFGIFAGAAFRFTPTGGTELLIPSSIIDLAGFSDVSSDDAIILGTGGIVDDQVPFLFSDAEGRTNLPTLPHSCPECGSAGHAISLDGLVVVGDNTEQATHWTAASGIVGLGHLFTGPTDVLTQTSSARSVSSDGLVVVGKAVHKPTSTERAFIWTKETGMLALRDVLVDLGLDMTGWKLTEATAISADGKTIAGMGLNPQGDSEAWRAVVPKIPRQLPALTPSGVALIALSLCASALIGIRRRSQSRLNA